MRISLKRYRVFALGLAASVLMPLPGRAEYVMVAGKGWRLCEALHKELKRQAPRNPDLCPVNMLLSLPGVTEAEWAPLDPENHAHAELLKKLTIYDSVGHVGYVHPRLRQPFRMPKESVLERVTEMFRKGEIRLHMTRVNLLHWNTLAGRADPAPETMVRKTYHTPRDPVWSDGTIEACEKRYGVPYSSPWDYLVKDDLSDIAVRNAEELTYGGMGNMLIYFEGKEYWVVYDPTGNGFDIKRDAHDTGYLGTRCDIRYVLPPSRREKSK